MARSDIDDGFREFHARNPGVYDALVAVARRATAAGKKRLSAKLLYEVVRFETWLGDEGAALRMNNDFTSRYARLIMEREPDLRGAFVTHRLKEASPSHGRTSPDGLDYRPGLEHLRDWELLR